MLKVLEKTFEVDAILAISLLKQVLFLVDLLHSRLRSFFEQGSLEPFFRLLFHDYPRIANQMDASWEWLLIFVYNFIQISKPIS